MSTHVVYLMARINQQTASDFRNMCLSAIVEGKATELIIHIGSVGGGIHEGFLLYHFLKTLPVKVTTTNAGSVESSAVLVYLAGSYRTASPMARFIFHPWTWDFGQGQRHIPVIKEALHSLQADMERFVALVEAETAGGNKKFDVHSSEAEAKALGAKEAVEYGIAHEIKESVTPKDAVIWSVTQAPLK